MQDCAERASFAAERTSRIGLKILAICPVLGLASLVVHWIGHRLWVFSATNQALIDVHQEFKTWHDVNACHEDLTNTLMAFPIINVDASRQTMVSRARLVNTMDQLTWHKIPMLPVQAVFHQSKAFAVKQTLISALQLCSQQATELCFILQDDAVLHPNLRGELACTLNRLPSEWRILHMCPRTTWGKKQQDSTKHFHFNPEYDHDLQGIGKGDRFFLQWPKVGGDIPMPGGPLALVLKRAHAEEVAELLKRMHESVLNDDQVLTMFHGSHDYIAKEPQLCYENQFTSSTFANEDESFSDATLYIILVFGPFFYVSLFMWLYFYCIASGCQQSRWNYTAVRQKRDSDADIEETKLF